MAARATAIVLVILLATGIAALPLGIGGPRTCSEEGRVVGDTVEVLGRTEDDVGVATQATRGSDSNDLFEGQTLFQEDFEDTDFASRGWYDNTNLLLSTTEHIAGSTSSVEFHFNQGETKPTSGLAMRMKFMATDEVYASYYVKYSSNWEGSNKPYHPHEFLILTNLNGDWDGPAWTHLTAYIEQNEGEPLLGIQDGQNINESGIGVDLTSITEERAVAGCNGDSDGHGSGDCYPVGSVHANGKQWRVGSVYFQDTLGQYYKNDWHFVEAYFKLNSIVGGKGVTDGSLKYWYDDALIIDHEDVMLRTGQHPTMKFNQFLIAPWIGDGSPVDQTMWVDNLTVATSRVGGPVDTTPPFRSSGSPTGTLPSGTTSTTMSLATDESATCRYSTTSGVSYSSMSSNFSTTDGTTHSTTIADLQDGQTHNYYVKCKDSSDNENTDDYTITLSVDSADTQAPSAPTNLQATAKSSSQIDISWDASTDDVGVAGYKVHRNGVHIGDSATTRFSDTGLTPSTTYTYTVSAYDAAGSESDHSNSASITTLQLPTTPQSNDAKTYDVIWLVLVAVLIVLALINMSVTRKLRSELSEHIARHTQKEEEPPAESSPNQDDRGL